MIKEHGAVVGQGRQLAEGARQAREEIWQEALEARLRQVGKSTADLKAEGKSVPWKLAVAAALKTGTTATNRWLGTALHMGNLHEVSRKVAAWSRQPDATLSRKLR